METTQSKTINDWLKLGPVIPLTNKPLYRLVFSDEQYELRKGTYTEWTKEKIKIREYVKTERVLKYNYLKERWIIERWFPPELVLNPELPESNAGSYEPIYVFEDSEGNELPLQLIVAQIVVRSNLAYKSSMLRKSEHLQAKEDKDKEAYDQDMDILNDEGPLVSQFHDKTAILNPTNKGKIDR